MYECPTGLCYVYIDEEPQLCVKTEYYTPLGGIEAYIVSSGELLSCEGLTGTQEGCGEIKAIPVSVHREVVC